VSQLTFEPVTYRMKVSRVIDIVEVLSRYSAGPWAGRSGFWGSIPGGGWEFFSSPPRPERLWDPLSLLSNGYQGLFPWRVKRPGCEADHSPSSIAEVKECVELYLHSPNTPSLRGA
jgi:hypothetical protein